MLEYPALEVVLKSLTYLPKEKTSPHTPYAFRYCLSIRNKSTNSLTIQGHKWVISSGGKPKIVIENKGIESDEIDEEYISLGLLAIGDNGFVSDPLSLEPGDALDHSNIHYIATSSRAHGAYFGITHRGEKFFTKIPFFDMEPPSSSTFVFSC